MADIHIEEFYKDTAVALVQLYGNGTFPRRLTSPESFKFIKTL